MNRRFTLFILAAVTLAAAARPGLAAGPKPGGSTSRIAFTTWAPSGGLTQVFLVNPDGSGKVQLTKELWKQHRSPAWSPDGSMLAVAVDIGNNNPDTGNYIKIIDVATGSYIQFSQGTSSLAWSSRRDAGTGAFLSWTQQRLAYENPGPGGYYSNLCVRAPDGSGSPVQLTANGQGAYASGAAWLPDSPGSSTARISYTQRVYTINPDGASTLTTLETRLITLDASAWPSLTVISDQPIPTVSALPSGINPPANLVWDRQAQQVAWARTGNQGFWLAPAAYDISGNLLGLDLANTRLLANTGTGKTWTVSFSPDGTQIAFLDAPAGQVWRSLYRINTNNTGITLVSKAKYGDINSQCWSP